MRWKASIFAISHIFKYHSILVLSVVLCELLLIYSSKLFFLGHLFDSHFLGVYRICTRGIASYLSLFFMFFARQMSFRGSSRSDIYNELVSLLGAFSSVVAIAICSNVIIRVYMNKLRLTVVFTAVLLHQFKLRRQRIDIIRALDRETIAAPVMLTFLTCGMFHVFVSFVFATGCSIVFKLLFSLLDMFQVNTPATGWNYVAFVDNLISFVPGMSGYTGSAYGLDTAIVFMSTAWVIAMIDAFYEHLNRQFSCMDPVIVNNLEEIPLHGSTDYEDELLLARAVLNYSWGVSMILNTNAKKFEPNGNAMNITLPEDTRRCPMVPFFKINQGPKYNIEPQRTRYQVDAVVYRMLVESSGKLFSSYVEAFVETLIEAEGHIVALTTSYNDSIVNVRIGLNMDPETCDACSSWLNFVLSFIPGMAPKTPYKAMDSLILAVLYMRGLANWLCIANMLGYNGMHVKQSSKEFLAQCVSLSKALGLVRRLSMHTHFSNTLDIVTNVINTSLKQMSVYADYMLYSSFDTDFDTFRLLEKMYKGNPQSTVG